MKVYFGVAVCLTLGLGFGAVLVLSLLSDARLRKWPSVAGVILDSAVRMRTTSRPGSGIHRTGGRPEYVVEVRYSYEVSGIAYTGDRISNHPLVQTLSDVTDAPAGWILALRERYAPGTRAQVYFDPDHPERSYLLFRAVTGLWLLGLCSVTFVALAILLWRYGSR